VSGFRPHNRRFDDPRLEMCWAATMSLEVDLQCLLLRELASELARHLVEPRNPQEKIRAAIVSLREARDFLGHSPSQYEFRLLRGEFPDMRLMADGTIRRALGNGTWNECLARAHLEAVSDGDFTERSLSPAFTLDDLVECIREYVREHDGAVPKQRELLGWLRDPRIQARPGHRPLSARPFTRFGYWQVLEAAGHGDVLREDVLRAVRPGYANGIRYRYSDAELLEAFHCVARELGRTPRETDYRDAHAESLRRVRQAGGGDALPSSTALRRRFGSWARVVEAAGHNALPEWRPGKSRLPRAPRYSESTLLKVLACAWVAIGEPFTIEAYARWRRDELRKAQDRSEEIFLPNVETITRRFGSWEKAGRHTRPGRPQS
jgi:hypothetical protein